MYSVWYHGSPLYSSNSLKDCLDYCLAHYELDDIFSIKVGDYQVVNFHDGLCTFISVTQEG